jgi:hypothetical protein
MPINSFLLFILSSLIACNEMDKNLPEVEIARQILVRLQDPPAFPAAIPPFGAFDPLFPSTGHGVRAGPGKRISEMCHHTGAAGPGQLVDF